MHSFAVIAGLVASANAYAYGYPAQNETTSAVAYPVASTTDAYAVISSAAAYPASSAPVEYTTKVVTGLTTECPEPTTISVGTKTYVVTSSTVIVDEDCEYTTSVPVHPTPAPEHSAPAGYPVKPSVVAPPLSLTHPATAPPPPTQLPLALPLPPALPPRALLLPSSPALLLRLVPESWPSSPLPPLSCKQFAT
ncbi:hypothetical protein JI435_159170 [Parastagonospora nodorum SN15]|uniref:Uncharacterized protein n=1 Tax=Phaeosphaeria nodorum (strain SN15 / ATCC MYA-4574 / FGSC 10173) TaxID=321614 RepID=A0A7U2F193_PHANO|nr:hypothetical protein JI435_159170 [Parastagonospora nodorum SN15]